MSRKRLPNPFILCITNTKKQIQTRSQLIYFIQKIRKVNCRKTATYVFKCETEKWYGNNQMHYLKPVNETNA